MRSCIKRAAQFFAGMLLVLLLASPSFAGNGGYSISGYSNSPNITYVGGYHRHYHRGHWARHYPRYYGSRYYYRPYFAPYGYYRPYVAYPYPYYYPAPGLSFFFRF